MRGLSTVGLFQEPEEGGGGIPREDRGLEIKTLERVLVKTSAVMGPWRHVAPQRRDGGGWGGEIPSPRSISCCILEGVSVSLVLRDKIKEISEYLLKCLQSDGT